MENAEIHFSKRAVKYNHSSNWVVDHQLIRTMYELTEAGKDAVVLDIATGTGLIAKEFLGKVDKVIGLDISPEMAEQAKDKMDEIHFSPAEKMPFDDNSFDTVVCRQGLQFVELDKVIAEIYRVLKPGGITVLCHLTAYGDEDKELTFRIQKLRNPARRNYFLPNDISNALTKQGFKKVENIQYVSDESVNRWIDNGAISEENMEWIKNHYHNAPSDFLKIHKVRFAEDDIIDSMLFMIAKGRK